MRMTRTISIVAAAVFGLMANTAIAQGGYGSLSYFDWEVDYDSDSPQIASDGIRAVGGYMFSDYIGIEGHVASGGTDNLEYMTSNGIEDSEAELNKMMGLFAKINLPLNIWGTQWDLFALAGYAHTRVDILAETTTTTLNQSSFAGGAGIDVALIPDRLYLTADYIEYASGQDLESSAASLGLRLNFGGQ